MAINAEEKEYLAAFDTSYIIFSCVCVLFPVSSWNFSNI